MKVVIVDDEPKAIDLLKKYLEHFRNVELVATFRNGLKAFEYLNRHTVDLVFLDINMPHITGLSLAKLIDSKIKVVFTTAYSEHAVESYEVSAVDYLLKPISLDRFLLAMAKVLGSEGTDLSTKKVNPFLWIKSSGKNYKLMAEEIMYLHKEGNYMTYFIADNKILARESIPEALQRLPIYFYQCHKSYIINLKQVTAVEKESLFINDRVVPMGSSFKDQVLQALNHLADSE